MVATAPCLAWLHWPARRGRRAARRVAPFDYWLFGKARRGRSAGRRHQAPQLILTVLGLGIASMFFTNSAIASACRYSGARPGRIGCGTISAGVALHRRHRRLPARPGRSAAHDLGGVYFNTIFILAMAGCYAGTLPAGLPWRRPCSAISRLATNCCRLLRFDGYSSSPTSPGCRTCSAGSAHAARSASRGRAAGQPSDLRRGAQVAVSGWIATTVVL